MLQILDNVWLGLNKGFNLDRNFILCAEENNDARFPDMGRYPSLDLCLKHLVDNDLNEFFYIVKKGAKNKGTNIFVGNKDFAYLTSVFLKSVLKNPELDSSYIFYKLYLEKQQSLPFSEQGTFANYLDILKEFEPLSIEDFKTEYDKAEAAEYFSKIDKSSFPINILLSEYILNPTGKYSQIFLKKYEERRWKEWTNILKDIAGEILDSSPALPRIFPDLQLNYSKSLINQLEKHPRTKWIFDCYNNNWDIKYIKETFDSSFFQDIIERVYGHYVLKETGLHILLRNMSYPVVKAFHDDIESGFKSEYLMNGDDSLFFSYIYQRKHEGRIDLLESYRLK